MKVAALALSLVFGSLLVAAPRENIILTMADDVANDREELNSIPLHRLTDEQRKAYKMFKEAMVSMPETNPGYQEKVVAAPAKQATAPKKGEEVVLDPIVADRPVVRVWPAGQGDGEYQELRLNVTNRGKIRYEHVEDPNLVVYQVEGDEPTPAVIYCPGGAYVHLSPRPELIEWLNANGVTVFMLRYTVPDDREAAFRDVQRAMRVVRSRANKWNIDPEQLGVVGSSAGGHLAARLSQQFQTRAYPAGDKIDELSCEPDFVVLLSAAYLLEEQGKDEEPVLADEFPMTAKVAPTFLVYAKDDRPHFPGGVAYEKALKVAGGSTRMLISETGGHGLKGVNWHRECRKWLEDRGVSLKVGKR